MDIVVDEARGGLHHVRPLDVQLAAVGEEGVGVVPGDLHDGLVLPAGALEHLVLALIGVGGQVAHVGDVHDPVHVVARKAQVLLQHVLHDVGAQVADVGEVVHRGAAGVHLHMAGGVGLELLFFVCGRIIQIHIASPFRMIGYMVGHRFSCHCEEQSDAAIRHTAKRIPTTSLRAGLGMTRVIVIARSEATRQSVLPNKKRLPCPQGMRGEGFSRFHSRLSLCRFAARLAGRRLHPPRSRTHFRFLLAGWLAAGGLPSLGPDMRTYSFRSQRYAILQGIF